MKVFVLTGYYEQEWNYVLGVYSTLELAREAAAQVDEKMIYDGVVIKELTLDNQPLKFT